MSTGDSGVSPRVVLTLIPVVLAVRLPQINNFLRMWVALDRAKNIPPDECLKCGHKIPSLDYRICPNCGHTTSCD